MPDQLGGASARNEASRQKSAFSLPSITLPKGGGAIHGMGEKFSANPATGAAALSIRIFATPNRADFYPKLSLSYDSASGNGHFGFGWGLSVPAITRKTDKGLPKYRDDQNSDVFILSGVEDLVPAFKLIGGNWTEDTYTASAGGSSFLVQRYRPRVEAPFLRIERWRDEATGDTHWRAVSKDNLTSIYGRTSQSRIADPNDPSRVFSWLLDNTYDDRGNTAVYQYKAEDSVNVPDTMHERNRSVTANRCIKRILYGNTAPYYAADGLPLPVNWYFELVFDYGRARSGDPHSRRNRALDLPARSVFQLSLYFRS